MSFCLLRGRIPALLAFLLVTTACAQEEVPQPTPSPTPPATATATIAAPLPTTTAVPGAGPICIETVTIEDGQLKPATLTVPMGCVVMFTNRGATIHQIQGPDFILGEIGKDQSWAHTYATPGNFEFWSTKDPALRGTITVQP